MKIVGKQEATRPFSDYASEIQSGLVVVTDHGKPVAVLVSVGNADLETVSLRTNPRFLALIERLCSRVRDDGGLSSEEMRRRFD